MHFQSGQFDQLDPFDPFASVPTTQSSGLDDPQLSPTKMADTTEKSSYDDEFADLLGDFSAPAATNGVAENGNVTTVVKETVTTMEDGDLVTTVTETTTRSSGDLMNGTESNDLMEQEFTEGDMADFEGHNEQVSLRSRVMACS